MHWLIYSRLAGSWAYCGAFCDWPDAVFYMEYLRHNANPFLVRCLPSGEVVEEWFPPNYNHNPATNVRERSGDCDLTKVRFPNLLRAS